MATNSKTALPGMIVKQKHHSFLVDVMLRLAKEKPLATVGGVIVLIMFLIGIFANFIAPYGYNDVVLVDRLTPPSATHLMGTDDLGRDLFSRIVYGARISMYVGLGVPIIAMVISLILGCASGFFGGKVDLVIQRFVDAVMCFPMLVIMLTVIAITGPGLVQVILVLGILGGIGGNVRVIRSAVMGIKVSKFVDAAKSIGSPDIKTLLSHILPNVMAPTIILFTVGMGAAILNEASLSFLGFGIPPPVPSWGGMLSQGGRTYMLLAPWLALWPGLALALVVWGINMLGDGLRDVLDPRLRGGRSSYGTAKKVKTPHQK